MKNNWENPVCDYCKNKEFRIEIDNITSWEYKGIFRIVKCTKCGLVYTSPRPKLSRIGRYYKDESYWKNILSNKKKEDVLRTRDIDYREIDDVIKNNKNKGRILDIGAGTGDFLLRYKVDGWEVEGIDLDVKAIKYAKKYFDIELKQGDFFDFEFKPNSYDVIVLNNALEHLYYPVEAISKIYKILKREGLIIVNLPNYNSFGRYLFKGNWMALQVPRHLYHFSPKILSEIFKNEGLREIKVQYNYFSQNYYILFQSFRYLMSPKFKKGENGGMAKLDREQNLSFKKEIGKLFFKTLSFGLVLIEQILGRGENMIVYGKK